MNSNIEKILVIQPGQSKEQWFKVVRNGTEYWESETYRCNEAIEAQRRETRAQLRKSTGFKEEEIEANADRLMALLESFYKFGDPNFDPRAIHCEAETKYGFEPDYVGKLINNLVDRKIVRFEYSQDPSLHFKDSLDYWRLLKIDT